MFFAIVTWGKLIPSIRENLKWTNLLILIICLPVDEYVYIASLVGQNLEMDHGSYHHLVPEKVFFGR